MEDEDDEAYEQDGNTIEEETTESNKLEWTIDAMHTESIHLATLNSTDLTNRVRFHYSLQREMECMFAQTHELLEHAQISSATIMEIDEGESKQETLACVSNVHESPAHVSSTSLKQFSVAPLASFGRAFKMFDMNAVKYLCRHELFPKGDRPTVHTVVDIFDEKKLRLKTRESQADPSLVWCDKRGRSIRTFRTNGIQVHLMWERIVSVPCLVDKIRAATYDEKRENALASIIRNEDGTPVDGRCGKRKPPAFLPASSEGAIFRPASARLEDYECGVFQSKSIVASREAALAKGISLSSLFPRVVAIDPGHIDIINSAVYNYETHDWKKGPKLSRKMFYHVLDPNHRRSRRKRREHRLKQTKGLAAKVKRHQEDLSKHSIKSSNPESCLQHLLLVRRCWKDMFSFYGSRNAARDQFWSEQSRRSLIDQLIQALAPEHLKKTTIIVLGAAKFATSFKGAQSTPIGMLAKEIAKVRRVVLMDEYNTTLMCSGCNLHGVGLSTEQHELYDRNNPSDNRGCEKYPLWGDSKLRAAPLGPKARQKPHQVHHPTSAMMSFRRTVVPKHERIRCETRLQKQKTTSLLSGVWTHVPDPKPPDPGDVDKALQAILSRPIHGLKQCTHCGRYVFYL